jgi:hypothetical protein
MVEVRDVTQLLSDDSLLEEALRQAALAARRMYVRAGLSMPAWCEGQLVWIEPRDLDQQES